MSLNHLSTHRLTSKQATALLLAVYFGLSALLFRSFQYIAYKDEVNYISIGEKFARGDFLNGANALWSPLMPLLLAPLISLGIDSIIAARVVQVLVGALAFFAIRAVSFRLPMSERSRLLVLGVSIPALVYCAFFAFNADLLLASVLLFYFSLVFDPSYPERRAGGWLCGILGGAAYLTKGFGFPFFILHFTLSTVGHFVFNKTGRTRQQVLSNFARGMLVFGCVVLAFGYMLNRKYHDPAVWVGGVSGTYNYAIRAPDVQPLGAPSSYAGFVKPWPNGAVSIWEEPYYFFKLIPRWSPFDSPRALKHQVKLIRTSSVNIIGFYGLFSAFSAAIVLGCLLLLRGAPGKESGQFGLAAALATVGLYTAFYAALYSEERYLWPMGFLILIMGGSLLDSLFSTRIAAGPFRQRLVAFAFAASFIVHPIDQLVDRANNGRELARISESLREAGVHGRIAASGDYGGSVVVAYHLGATFYGHPKPGMSLDETIGELKKHSIQYYLNWFERTPLPDSAFQRIDAFAAYDRQVTVYAVRP